MQNSAIFPVFYLPPISFFTEAKAFDFNIVLEKFEHFPKQTFRNRTTISSPNGRLDLTIPVIKGSKNHTAVKDVRLSYDLKWQRLHWLSLQNCYRNSAYFEYYEDGLAPFYEKKFEYLFDYNLELLNWVFKQLKLNPDLQTTTSYRADVSPDRDFRIQFQKNKIELINTKPYFQVFSDRNPFLTNLSIVDLLFTQGPQAKAFI